VSERAIRKLVGPSKWVEAEQLDLGAMRSASGERTTAECCPACTID
jgi:hypothetical protein